MLATVHLTDRRRGQTGRNGLGRVLGSIIFLLDCEDCARQAVLEKVITRSHVVHATQNIVAGKSNTRRESILVRNCSLSFALINTRVLNAMHFKQYDKTSMHVETRLKLEFHFVRHDTARLFPVPKWMGQIARRVVSWRDKWNFGFTGTKT